MAKVYSNFNDDYVTIMVHAKSPKDAKKKTEKIIKKTGIEGINLDTFFEDDITESEIEGVTVEQWLEDRGVEFTENTVLVIDYNDVQVYEL